MKVLFDILGLPPHGGAKTSALGWIRSIAEMGSDHQFFALASNFEPVLEGPENLEQLLAPMLGRFAVRAWAQAYLPRIVRLRGIHLVHFAKNHGCFLVPCPTVITINDFNRFYYPAMFSRVDVLYWRTVQSALLKNVEQVIAISENTKRDLMHFYRLPPEKIEVIYPAVDPAFREQKLTEAGVANTLKEYGLRRPYILSVGGMAVHKNVYSALRAFYSLIERGFLPDLTFVIVGERFHTHNDQRLFDLAARDGAGRVSFTGVVAEEDLPAIYAGSSLFVYPSLYEGFGLAPIEAMASGVPVLASRAGSLPEVLGEAAWLVEDPTDVDAIAEGMLRLLTDASTWEKLRKLGLENARRFSWPRTASQTLDLYQRLVHG